MNRAQLLASTVVGFVIGAVAINSLPANAQMAVVDASEINQTIQQSGILSAIKGIMTTMNNTITDVKTFTNDIFGALGDNTFGTVQQLLQEGFTQNANYSKAQIGAMQQITDASNLANAQFQMQIRQRQIQDQQTVSPNNCTALDGGVSTTAAAVQGYDVGWTIANIHNARGQAQPGMPSYYGEAQAVASMTAEHLAKYCDAKDVAAGYNCTVSSNPDGDADYSSLTNSGTYWTQDAITAAKDYAVNLIEPIAPPAIRGDQLNSVIGQEAGVRRHSFDARMSLAQSVVDLQVGMQSPSVPITAQQSQYLTNQGQPLPPNGRLSWFQALQIEAERRLSDVGWAAALAAEPPYAVQREIAQELALSNYLAFQNFRLQMQHVQISASQLAETTEHNYMPVSQLPTPSIASTKP